MVPSSGSILQRAEREKGRRKTFVKTTKSNCNKEENAGGGGIKDRIKDLSYFDRILVPGRHLA